MLPISVSQSANSGTGDTKSGGVASIYFGSASAGSGSSASTSSGSSSSVAQIALYVGLAVIASVIAAKILRR